MDPLRYAWTIALIVTVIALPVGAFRMLIYRSGEIDHTPTLRTAAVFALALGLVGLISLLALTAALLAR